MNSRGPIPSEPPSRIPDRRLMWQQHEPLMDEPGTWFLIGDYASYKTAQSITSELRNHHRRVPPGEWEYRFGEIPPNLRQDKPFGIWARYMGPPEEENMENWK